MFFHRFYMVFVALGLRSGSKPGGACLDVSQDIACANSKGCATCGGTWCAGPKCVKASSDRSNPCGTAYPDSVATQSDFCGGSEQRCKDCSGAARRSMKKTVKKSHETHREAMKKHEKAM